MKQTNMGTSNRESPMAIGVHFDCAGSDRGEVVQAWANEILDKSLEDGLDVNSPDYTLLGVYLKPCGGSATYRTIDDIPLVDVPCPCGDPNHWLIKYTEVKQRNSTNRG